jgi:hypothetical protein
LATGPFQTQRQAVYRPLPELPWPPVVVSPPLAPPPVELAALLVSV